jgi:hypothetical protein
MSTFPMVATFEFWGTRGMIVSIGISRRLSDTQCASTPIALLVQNKNEAVNLSFVNQLVGVVTEC